MSVNQYMIMELRITGPFIDKITITIPAETDYVENLVSLMRDTVESGLDESYTVQSLTNRPDNLYRWSFRVWAGNTDGEFIHVSAIHSDPRKNQLRLEFNPARMAEVQLSGIHDFLSLVFNDVEYSDLRDSCSVTRVDVAQDIVGLKMDDVLVYSPRKHKGCIWGGGKQGIETVYCGTRSSRGMVRVYNKPFTRPASGHHSHQRRVRNRPRIRCEVTLKPQCQMAALYDLRNPFRDVVMAYLAGVKRNTTLPLHETQFFVDSCLRRGTQDALALIEDKREKKKYRTILGQSRVEEISADALWTNWPNEVDRLKRIMGYARLSNS